MSTGVIFHFSCPHALGYKLLTVPAVLATCVPCSVSFLFSFSCSGSRGRETLLPRVVMTTSRHQADENEQMSASQDSCAQAQSFPHVKSLPPWWVLSRAIIGLSYYGSCFCLLLGITRLLPRQSDKGNIPGRWTHKPQFKMLFNLNCVIPSLGFTKMHSSQDYNID